MSKTIVKTENRQRVQANLVSFVDNGNGTAVVSDVPANVNVEGTRLDEDLINGIQEGLVFTVDAALSANAGYDLYTLGLVGMAGADSINGFPIFEGLSLNFKALGTNTQNVVKLALSGTEYDLVKIQNGVVVNMVAGEIINGNYYNVIFDGVRFNINLSNLQSYGTITGTALEGNQLGKILGVESSKIGGLISTVGTKTAGNIYYDMLTESYYICNATNNQNFIDLVNFTPISNTDLLNKTKDLLEIRETVSGTGSLGTVKFFRLGKRVTFFVYFGSVGGFSLSDATKIADYPQNFTPDEFFLNSEHSIASVNASNKTGARLVILLDGIYVYGVASTIHTELKGSLNYVAK